jgi:SAM (Sterile alpha motif) domain-containing protein
MDVVGWLRGLGLERYVPAFRDNDIDGEVLRRLTAEDLRELGIASIGHRRRLLDAIAALGENQHAVEAKPLPADAVSGQVERCQLTVMFCDLVGSTPLSARVDPEDLRGILGAYHRCVTEIVEGFGGFVLFIGRSAPRARPRAAGSRHSAPPWHRRYRESPAPNARPRPHGPVGLGDDMIDHAFYLLRCGFRQ